MTQRQFQGYGTDRRAQDVDSAGGKVLGTTICCLAIGMTIFNLGFIIPSLVYGYSRTLCVQAIMPGIAFPLATWLKVDAYTRIGLIALLLLVAIVSCFSLIVGATLLACALIIIFIYSLFSLAWTIVGAVLFWGRLERAGYCWGGIRVYMYIFLILSFIGICFSCVSLYLQRKAIKFARGS